ncbi:uncharacterized protein LOC122050852 [Zingiber officinale]|uniref:uncharacterized protein LOC122050852 n=1 Tax=Zingiber officinale TaxID=94328 RepID=UPI001C4D1D2A|nr:uncharacterized protein LOC122050852 [Zingiber officinale]
METIKAGNKGYAAELLVVTFNQRTKHADGRSKFRIFLSFEQHGRELITTEVALQLLSVLAEECSMQSYLSGNEFSSMLDLLDNLVIKVAEDKNLKASLMINRTAIKAWLLLLLLLVPMENLNGRKLVEAEDLCERRNGMHIDLNKNWAVDRGKKDYDPYEENTGTAPFSEPEAQIMQQLAKSFEPHIWSNVHSGTEALFMPYDHRNITPAESMSNLMDLVLRELNHVHFEDKCLVGSGGGLVGYLAHGTTTEYMYDAIKVPMAFTFEIYGDPEASSKDSFKMFNPIDKHVFNVCHLRTLRLMDAHFAPSTDLREWVPFGDRVADGSLIGEIKNKMDGLELGKQDTHTYFRLFLLSYSSVLLLFLFCSKITKSKYRQIN